MTLLGIILIGIVLVGACAFHEPIGIPGALFVAGLLAIAASVFVL